MKMMGARYVKEKFVIFKLDAVTVQLWHSSEAKNAMVP